MTTAAADVMEKAGKLFVDDLEKEGLKPKFELEIPLDRIREKYSKERSGSKESLHVALKIYSEWVKATGIKDEDSRVNFHSCILEAIQNVIENTKTETLKVRCYLHNNQYYMVFKDQGTKYFDIDSIVDPTTPDKRDTQLRGRGILMIKGFNKKAYSQFIEGPDHGLELYMVNDLPKK